MTAAPSIAGKPAPTGFDVSLASADDTSGFARESVRKYTENSKSFGSLPRYAQRLKISEVFTPPNAKLLFIT